MAPFDPRAFFNEDRDFQLLNFSPVALFRSSRVLDETTTWLGEHGYQVTRIDASNWSGLRDLHRDVAAALDFPDYYGRNFNALNDCLRDVVHQHCGWTPGTTGLAIVLTGYDAFAGPCPDEAWTTLDLIAKCSRAASLFGRRLLCLVQSIRSER